MTDWYYHDPAEGRVGPLTAEVLRKRFQERRIQRDTLVWHQALREWQPLERMAPELGLETMQVDTALPPPIPGNAAGPPTPAAASRPAAARGKYARAPLKPKKTLPTAAIVVIAVAVLAIPGVMILASIALPAYRDYARQADSMGALTGLAIALKRETGAHAIRTGRCLGNGDPGVKQLRDALQRRAKVDVRFASIDGGCAFEITVNADGQPLDGKTLRYEGFRDGGTFAWQCAGGDMPNAHRPYECRNDN